jgi:hypothetical protein
MAARTVTQSIESDADLTVVFELIANPGRIPDWAAAFADVVTENVREGWRATKGGEDFTFRAVARQDAGTVDYLREIAPGREGGAYLRVVPRPAGGTVIIMTLPVGPNTDPTVVASTLRQELDALARLADIS